MTSSREIPPIQSMFIINPSTKSFAIVPPGSPEDIVVISGEAAREIARKAADNWARRRRELGLGSGRDMPGKDIHTPTTI
ncbi:MAG: hypothetical protein HYU48_02435 [Candidatus Levybacteria bacterium]|nr:hypothetical protein [Candidatus Levybacteria bacterium]